MCFIGLASSGCAYRMGYTERELPGGHQQVAIPVFSNKTAITGLEVPFTNSLLSEFSKSKVAKIVDKNRAPAVILGTISNVEVIHGGAINRNDEDDVDIDLPQNTVITTEYRILVAVSIRLQSAVDQQIIWQGEFKGERVYTAPQIGTASLNSANALYNQNARFETIAQMSRDLMAEAHDRISENF